MVRHLILDGKEQHSLAELFTEYLSDISLEVEAIKLRNIKSDSEGVNEHLARIDNALKGIMDAKLALAENLLRSQTQNYLFTRKTKNGYFIYLEIFSCYHTHLERYSFYQ